MLFVSFFASTCIWITLHSRIGPSNKSVAAFTKLDLNGKDLCVYTCMCHARIFIDNRALCACCLLTSMTVFTCVHANASVPV